MKPLTVGTTIAAGLRALLTAATVTAAVLALPAAQARAAGPGSARSAADLGGRIHWGPCTPPGPRLQCAHVRVPLDWVHPDGRTIQLAVIRHLASKPRQRIGSLFINPGGPGDTGVGLVHGAGAEFDKWGAGRFNVVSWDPRGTNASSHVRCFTSRGSEARFWKGVTIPASRAASARYARTIRDLARRCAKVSGWLLPHVSTADSARDLDYLRHLVGDRQLTYVGLSYGSYLGQTYANMFPGRVRAMLLDAIVDPIPYSRSAEARVASQAFGADPVFHQMLALCQRAGSTQCALAGGGQTAVQRVNRLFARLKRAPIPAPNASPAGELTYTDLLVSQFNFVRIPDTWPEDARDLAAAVHGNGSALLTVARQFATPAAFMGATTSAAISCADAPARASLRSWPQVIGRLSRVDRLYGHLLGWWLWAPCASWPVRGQDSYHGPWDAKTKNPILLIGMRHDPATAYRDAVRSARRLGNAVLLTQNGYGHVSFNDPSACIDRARVAYLVKLITPATGTVCASDKAPFTAAAAGLQNALPTAATPGDGAPVVQAHAGRGGLRPIDDGALRGIVRKTARELHIPGAFVLLRSPQGTFTATYGTTRLGSRTRPQPDTHFRIASITKTMTSAVILQLAQEGKLRLTDPVSKYVAGVPNGEHITIAMLLQMRSGLYDYTSSATMAPFFDNDPTKVWRPRQLLAISFAHPPNFAPGTDYEYSNTNYALLGLIIQQVDHRPLATAMQKRLFGPLGLADTMLPPSTSNAIPKPRAHGYLYGSSSVITTGVPDPAYTSGYQAAIRAGTAHPTDYTDVNHSFATAAGGVISTADDLATWIRALVRGRVLDHKYQSLWRAGLLPTGQAGMDYGFGINRLRWGPNSLYLHGGETVGYNSEAAYDPTNKLTLVVWTNLTVSPFAGLTANRLMVNVLDRAYKLSPLAPGAIPGQAG